MSILWISCCNEIPVLYHKWLPDASTMQEIASLLEHVHRFVFHILRIGSVVVSQSPEGQVIARPFQAFCQPGEPSPVQHTSPRVRIDRPCQYQDAVADGTNHFVLFEKLQALFCTTLLSKY